MEITDFFITVAAINITNKQNIWQYNNHRTDKDSSSSAPKMECILNIHWKIDDAKHKNSTFNWDALTGVWVHSLDNF